MSIDLVAYRAHFTLAAEDLDSSTAVDGLDRVIAAIAADPVLLAVLDHHPFGADQVLEAIAGRLATRDGNGRDSAGSLLRVHLLRQVDVLWAAPEAAH